jgi:hypothetical protein
VICQLCGEPVEPGSEAPVVGTLMHSECGLRMALGGIGHLIDHAYWCLEKHDPDGGLSYRDSALMVATWVQLNGGPYDRSDD